jgi:hypothetical protein
MLGADPKRAMVQPAHCVGHDNDPPLRQNLVDPTIEDVIHGDLDAESFGEFAHEADRRLLVGFEPAAWQFPFAAFVFEQRDPVAVQHHPLDRHRKRHRLCSCSVGTRAARGHV